MPNAPDIILHETVDQAPKELRDAILSEGAENDVEAVYWNGEIHAFPKHMESVERALFVIGRHEVRHYGMRTRFGRKLDEVLHSMWRGNPTLREATEGIVKAGRAGIKERAKAIEEALADMPVEQVAALKHFDRFVAAVRQWLRETAVMLRRKGMGALADAIDPKAWTDNDVAAFVLNAEKVSGPGGTGGAFSRPTDAEAGALQALSDNDDLFALPRSQKDTVEAIVSDIDPTIKVKESKLPGAESLYTFTMPDGAQATMTVRKPNPYGPSLYAYDMVGGDMVNQVTERPGENPEDVDPDVEDVWIDVSKLKTGEGGNKIYANAANFAHNTNRIFIGDPAGLSDAAMRRRSEAMLST